MKMVIILIFIGLALNSCSNNMILVGRYKTSGIVQLLDLEADSTFTYSYYLSSFPLTRTHGKWKYIGNDLIELKSINNFNYMPIHVNEKYINGLDTIEFIIKEQEYSSFKIIEYKLFLDNIELIKQTYPVIKLPESKVTFNSFAINVIFEKDSLPEVNFIRYDVTTETYHKKSINSNAFEITIPFEEFGHYGENIESDTIIVKGSSLYWKRKGEILFKKRKQKY